jgi:2-phospho-L-lactate guanylyltransferase (CobY/MobA/RfbA family)
MDDPKLLVVLPTLGERPELLTVALESCATLREKVPLTLVVVLPSAAHSVRSLCENFGAVLVDDPGTGMAGAINAALAVASSEQFYVWVGDDDRLVAKGVAELVDALDNDATAVVAYGHCDYVDQTGRVVAQNRAGRWARFFLSFGPNLIPHPGTIVRLRPLADSGGFNPNLRYALDLDVFLRLRDHGRFISLKTVSAQFRWHPESLTVADRKASGREAVAVKNSHLPVFVRPISFLWNFPVSWASAWAAKAVNQRAGSSG